MLNPSQEGIERILRLLLIRFNLSPSQSLFVIQDWLAKHLDQTWEDLEELVDQGVVIVENNVLLNVYPLELYYLVKEMRSSHGVKLKNRRYLLKVYNNCFIGSEAVEWLVRRKNITREEAIQLGQLLMDYQIINHVANDHSFKDEYLFYHFC